MNKISDCRWYGSAFFCVLVACIGCSTTTTAIPTAEQPRSGRAQDTSSSETSNVSTQTKPGHLRGKFVWFELATSDPERAAAFYTQVLNWRIVRSNTHDNKSHAIMNAERNLGLIKKLDSGQRPTAQWMGYMSAPNLDAAVRAVGANGGKIVAPATSVAGVGRFAVVSDPEGAVFSVFTSAKGDPPDHEPGSGDWIWNELWARDPSAAFYFYAAVAGYTRGELSLPSSKYPMLVADGVARGGINNLPKGQERALWVPYVKVGDADAVVKVAEALGGVILMQPTDMRPVGRVAVLADPTGGIFGLVARSPKR